MSADKTWLQNEWDTNKQTLLDPDKGLYELKHAQAKRRTVTIPACSEHNGFYSMDVTLNWVCPVCGGPRGEPFETHSYDGSRRLGVHGWRNECGHIDKYESVREEWNAYELTHAKQAVSAARDVAESVDSGAGELLRVLEYIATQNYGAHYTAIDIINDMRQMARMTITAHKARIAKVTGE